MNVKKSPRLKKVAIKIINILRLRNKDYIDRLCNNNMI